MNLENDCVLKGNIICCFHSPCLYVCVKKHSIFCVCLLPIIKVTQVSLKILENLEKYIKREKPSRDNHSPHFCYREIGLFLLICNFFLKILCNIFHCLIFIQNVIKREFQ